MDMSTAIICMVLSFFIGVSLTALVALRTSIRTRNLHRHNIEARARHEAAGLEQDAAAAKEAMIKEAVRCKTKF